MKSAGLALVLVGAAASSGPLRAEILVKLGSARTAPGQSVEIPVHVEGASVSGFQFDVRITPEDFGSVELSDCLAAIDGALSACDFLPAPNDDVIRLIAVSMDRSPLRLGTIGRLGFTVSTKTTASRSPLDVVGCTAFYLGEDLSETHAIADPFLLDGVIEIDNPKSAIARQKESSRYKPLYDDWNVRAANFDAPAYVQAEFDVSWQRPVNELPTGLRAQLPDGKTVEFDRVEQEFRHGYVRKVGCEDTMLRDPAIPDSQISYRWYGESSDGEYLALTAVDGYVDGALAPRGELAYQIDGPLTGNIVLTQLDKSRLPPVEAARSESHPTAPTSQIDPIESAAAQSLLASEPITLDVLVLYTPQAEIDAGGQSALAALIQGAVDDLNQTLANSDLGHIQADLAGTTLLNDYVPSGSANELRDSLLELKNNATANFLRDLHAADIVSVIARNSSGSPPTDLGACGAAFLQNQVCFTVAEPIPGCGPLSDFEDFAFNFVAANCARAPNRHSFVHEIGHNLGSEHQREAIPLGATSPDAAIFPWAYAYRVPGDFFTMMYAEFDSVPEPLILNFSNPRIAVGGVATGVDDLRDNALVIDSTASTVAAFRGAAPELLFANSFEEPGFE